MAQFSALLPYSSLRNLRNLSSELRLILVLLFLLTLRALSLTGSRRKKALSLKSLRALQWTLFFIFILLTALGVGSLDPAIGLRRLTEFVVGRKELTLGTAFFVLSNS